MATFRRVESRLTPGGSVNAGPRVQALDLQPVAQGLSDYAKVQEQRDLDQAVFESRRQLDQWERENVFDPEKGAINRKGQDSFGLTRELPEAFDKFVGELTDKIQDPRARMAAQRVAQGRREQLTGWADRHVFGERERFLDQQYQADILSMQTNAAMFVADPARLRTEFSAMADRTVTYLKSKGASNEVIALAMKTNAAKAHEGVILSLVEKDPERAKAYLQENGKYLDDRTRMALEKPIKDEADNREADRITASVAALPLPEQLAEVSKITDPDLRQKAIQRVKENEGLKRLAQQEREKGFSDQAWQLVGQGKKIPSSILDGMDGRERVQLQDYQKQRAEHIASKGNAPVKTDPKTLAKLLDLQASDPQKFAQEFRAEAYAYALSGTDLEQMNKARIGILTPKPGKDIVSFNNKVTGRIDMAGWGGDSNQEKRGAFRVAAQKEWERLTETKSLTPREEDALLDSLMLPGKTGWFADGEAKTYAESVASGKPYQIRSDADYEALPSGAMFLDPKGQRRVKP